MSLNVQPSPESQTVREAIDRMAGIRGDAVFLIDPERNRRLTFRQMRDRASHFCSHLLAQGVNPGDRVASLLDNSLFAAESFLGAMYGGFVPVPLNPSAGPSEIEFALDQSEPRVLFIAPECDSLLRSIDRATRRLAVEIIDGQHDSVPIPSVALPEVGAEDDALIVYTSGSTGRPKGVLVSHRNVIAGGWNTVVAHQLSERDCSLCMLPLYHMNAQIVTLMSTLLSGGSVVLPRRFSARHFWRWISEERCTWSALVPSLISQLVNLGESRGAAEKRAHFRFARSSSAPLPPALHEAFEERFGLPLIEAMGSTEAGGAIFSNPLAPAERKSGSPGIPWGFECRILDETGGELPALRAGEIQVRGSSVMKGYYRDPRATAEVLDSAGWLHTGDLGYRDADGYLFIRGRRKEIINRGGDKIAPREIDETLARHPEVLEAAAVGVPDQMLGEDVVACVVRHRGAHCTEAELLEFCQQTLGLPKSPSRVYFVEELPHGPSGKVKRSELAKRIGWSRSMPPLSAVLAQGAEADADLSRIEIELAAVWSEFLSAGGVRSSDNFFALGGDSLLAMRMLARLNQRFEIGLLLSFFFAHPTVASQAAAIQHLRRVAPAQALPDAHSSQREENIAVLPLLPAQERLLFLSQLDLEAPVYQEPEAFRIAGPLDVAALEAALNAVVARHPALRISIHQEQGCAVQVVHQNRRLRLEQIDLSKIDGLRREAELASRLTAELWKPLDLADVLLRAVLFELAPREHVLVLVLHHLICDGWSMGILHRELALYYGAYVHGEPCQLDPLHLRYGTFVEQARARLRDDEAASKDVAYWRERLRGAPELLELPTDRPRPAVISHRGATAPVEIDAVLAGKLRALARQEKVSLFTLITAAFKVLLSRYSGQTDIVLGIPVANRHGIESGQLIGLLVDMLVLRSELAGDPSFREALARVGRTLAEALTHHALGVERIVEIMNPTRALDHDPLFQVTVNWRDREFQFQQLNLDGLRVAPVKYPKGTTRFDLTLSLVDAGDRIHGEVEYRTDLWDAPTVSRLIGHYQTLLEAVVENPARRISELALLTKSERKQTLVEWNRTATRHPGNCCIHELFEGDYMVPSVFVLLDGLPLTPPGKVDKRALPVSERPNLDQPFAAPRNAIQEAVATVWAKLLRLEHVGADDDFFDLGGHSLHALQIISRIRDLLEVEVPLRVLFDAPTLEGFSTALLGYESSPGQTEKIARLLRHERSLPPAEVRQRLDPPPIVTTVG